MLFLLCSLIFPTEISEYDGYADYFLSRRAWFFSLLIDQPTDGRRRHMACEGRDARRRPWAPNIRSASPDGRPVPDPHASFATCASTPSSPVGALIYFAVYVVRHYGHIQ
jgi:hypothetical protein